MNRRAFLVTAAAGVTRMTAQTPEVPEVIGKLKPMTDGIQRRILPFGLVIPASGEPVWIVPASDEARAHQAIKMFKDVRLWKEDEGPFKPAIGLLKERGR